MATEEGPIPPGDEYPPAALPTVYADGVLNLVNNPNTVKFYLYRLDANLSGGHASKVQPFAQVGTQSSFLIGCWTSSSPKERCQRS